MSKDAIAIIALGAMLPGALDVRASWQMLLEKRSQIGVVPPSRWDAALYYDPDPKAPYRTTSKIGSFLPDDLGFQARDFGMPPILQAHLDPTQQLALLTAQQTLADAHATDRNRRNWAVIVGNLLGGSWKRGEQWLRTQHVQTVHQLEQSTAFRGLPAATQAALVEAIELRLPWSNQPTMTPDSLPGLLGNIIASRISHYYNLTGPNYTIDAACATSLAAIEQAVLGLRARRYDVALAGGVDRIMDASSYIGFSKMGVLSPTHSSPFDARANGFVMGEGAAFFLLKRLEDAWADQDKIYAVIRGVGSSTDGCGRAIAAPNPDGQIAALRRAYQDAQVDPASIGLIECHGTSTPIGDPTEIAAMAQLWSRQEVADTIAIGSIKSNLGHLKGAAGAAAMLKAVLALHHQTLPPQQNFDNPNPNCAFDKTPFAVQTHAAPWSAPANRQPRRCGVSAFGFGGINVHIVLEEAPMTSKDVPLTSSQQTPQSSSSAPTQATPPAAPLPLGLPLLALGASSPQAMADKLNALLARETDASLIDQLREEPLVCESPYRLAFYAPTEEEGRTMLRNLAAALSQGKSLKKLEAKGVAIREGDPLQGKIAFMFPGQGSQYLRMLNEFKEDFSLVQETLAQADAIMTPLLGQPLSTLIDPPPEVDEGDAFVKLLQTEVLQPAVLTADFALWKLLEPLLPVELVMGHSLGEYAAAIAAGVFSFEDALRIVAARGEAIAAIADEMDDVGAMIGVNAAPEIVQDLLDQRDDGYVVIANKNCPTQTIIAGASDPTHKAAAFIEEQGYETVQLPVSHAFHSEIVSPASPFLRKELDNIEIHAPRKTILSNVTALPYPTDEDAPTWIRETLSVHLARPVEWQAMVEYAYQQGFRYFLEVGPKRALSSFARDILQDRPHRAYFCAHPKFGEKESLGRTLAALIADGLLLYGTQHASSTLTDQPAAHAPAQPPPAASTAQAAHDQASLLDPEEYKPTLSLLAYAAKEPNPTEGVPTPRFPFPAVPHNQLPDFSVSSPTATYVSQVIPHTPLPPTQTPPPTHPPAQTPPAQSHYVPPPQPPLAYAPHNDLNATLQDPGFWQFIALQGPHLFHYLVQVYRAMHPAPSPNPTAPHATFPPPVSPPTAPQGLAFPQPSATPFPAAFPGAPYAQPPAPQQTRTQPTAPPYSPPAHHATPTMPPTNPYAHSAAGATPGAPQTHDAPPPQASPGHSLPYNPPPTPPPTSVGRQHVPTATVSLHSSIPPQNATAPPSATAQDLTLHILSLVAERTGYTIEELDLDEHLEADLGIDSIRQIEIMSELRDTLKLPRDDDFRMGDYSTLRALIGYVERKLPQSRERAAAGSAPASPEDESAG